MEALIRVTETIKSFRVRTLVSLLSASGLWAHTYPFYRFRSYVMPTGDALERTSIAHRVL